ncbi:MAG: effector-associated domain EAD1-containing protein [Myxococcota bacterium]
MCPEHTSCQKRNNRAARELAKIFCRREEAIALATTAGFPAGQVPDFKTPQVFWTQVIEQSCNGVLPDGIRPLLENAAELFPHNDVLNHLISADNDPSARRKQELDRTFIIEANLEKTRAEARLLQAQAMLTQAQAFRELANAASALRRCGYEIVIQNENEGNFHITIRHIKREENI